MSNLSPQSSDQKQQSDIPSDENFENDDLVSFQHDSKTINLYFSQLTKYSKHVRDTYLFPDILHRLPQEIHKFQEENQLSSGIIDYFFQLLHQNYDINEDSILTYIQCTDLLKMSNFFEVRKLSYKINQYIKSHKVDVDFIIQMLEYDLQIQTSEHPVEISKDIEELLSSKINECFSNEKFKELPVHVIYRVIKSCSPGSINSNKLYDIISRSLKKFCVLFPFLELQKLSDDRLEELCESYSKSNESTKQCFDYLKCNLNLIIDMNIRRKNLQQMSEKQQGKMVDLEAKIEALQKKFTESEKVNNQLQSQLDQSKDLNNQQLSKMTDLEEKIETLQKKFVDSEVANNKLQIQVNGDQQNRINNLENLVIQLQTKLESSEKKLKEKLLIKGKIVASVENGLFINAEVILDTKDKTFDTSKSKVIVSSAGVKYLGSEAYEMGEQITSPYMKTSFAKRAGTYYVRCIVYNSEGESEEIVSNSVITSGSCLTFDYQGKPAKISLPHGKYKLEVWGAKGGDSTGKGRSSRANISTVKGGLGGYSSGILNLIKNETIYVLVGGEGRPSNSSDGSSTSGGYPDGGGTRTGYCTEYPTVPGTGGGSTSIRIGSDTDYARVIVAGGGGGASGCCWAANPGGFGGGQCGGNCTYNGSLKSQGAGTQAGSTPGLGSNNQRIVDPGVFGQGATSKYIKGCHSGGGGGGGWYGGNGNHTDCSSGGGGSGWTFTEQSHNDWRSGDSSNASKFTLDRTYYLSDVMCMGGNENFPCPNGNGTEQGHTGNGYAKITPQ